MNIDEQIEAVRKELGRDLLILGHHYQPDAVLKHVDFSGDSLELSRKAAQSQATKIVFCGVKFMAETADILVRDAQGHSVGRKVYLPAANAGCPMADMATAPALEAAWARITAADPESRWVPVVYVNSSAEVKAFCGRHGGSACTSGNGERVLKHFFDLGYKVFFAPDRYLSANILHDLGYADVEYCLYGDTVPAETLRAARLVAWPGYCPIHEQYHAEDVAAARKRWPDAEIMVHPESCEEVTRAADRHGSTKGIIQWLAEAQPGKTYVVGTEQSLVARLMARHAGLDVQPLKPVVCADMGLTTPEALLAVLTQWPERHCIHVEDALVMDARLCVEKMLAL